MIHQTEFFDLFGAVGELEFQKTVVKTDLFHAAFRHNILRDGVDQFIFHRTAATVQNQNLHSFS